MSEIQRPSTILKCFYCINTVSNAESHKNTKFRKNDSVRIWRWDHPNHSFLWDGGKCVNISIIYKFLDLYNSPLINKRRKVGHRPIFKKGTNIYYSMYFTHIITYMPHFNSLEEKNYSFHGPKISPLRKVNNYVQNQWTN